MNSNSGSSNAHRVRRPSPCTVGRMGRQNLIRTPFRPYHVVNQVNNKEWFHLPIGDVWDVLSEQCYEISEIHGARIHGFVLMSNHFHLIVSSPVSDLGIIMQHFSSFATRTYNRKSGRVGHLFRGRYKWSMIDSPLYYAHALKYIYRNPVRAGICQKVETYAYSSLQGVLHRSRLPFPVTTGVKEQFGHDLVPEKTCELVTWLNQSLKNEDNEWIRKALRRKTFEFSKYRTFESVERLENGLI